ncbi:hypothetical protein T265_03813 [Opisthorchis viverrini]|uniref:Ribosome biogenesis protein BRX1 homolog n=1 Tax=Opisthorchis viverrini TaxID=6198 RepID=A0A075A264_OPIVI|nr:hypothetical protein T265_03813 [Opisthorchis viverrini]KER29615.1 hypothetical protein T265_03813 [Opisthorchis viverrini]
MGKPRTNLLKSKVMVNREIASGAIRSSIPLKQGKKLNVKPKLLPSVRKSDQSPSRKKEWINRERILLLASRGVSYIGRYLMKDLLTMMPHGKKESKLDTKRDLSVLNELAEISHTNKNPTLVEQTNSNTPHFTLRASGGPDAMDFGNYGVGVALCSKAESVLLDCIPVIFFEARKKKDLYLWISCVPNGPCAKFLVENVHTTSELKLTGNCLKASRPVLAFDTAFEDPNQPHLCLLREIFVQTFGTPNQHPRSQPYFDKTFVFGFMNNRIWFRNYQLAEESGALVEVGPRFSLSLIRIFAGSFCGAVLFSNPNYISPNWVRHNLLRHQKDKYAARTQFRVESEQRKKNRKHIYEFDELDDIYE